MQDSSLAQQATVAPQENHFTLPKEQHPWTKFEPQAWRIIRITTETFNPDGKVASRSVTTQTEVLKAISEESYTLDVQATVDLAGKLITGKRQTHQLGILTDSSARVGEIRKQEPADVIIGDQTIRCEVWEIAAQDEQRKYLQRIFYAHDLSPFLLQREISELPDGREQPPRSTHKSKVVAFSVPYVVKGEPVACSCLKVVQNNNKGSTVRMELRAENVPGGVVAAWTTDFDARRRASRWSLLELVDFGTTARSE